MVALGIERGVGQHPVPKDQQRGHEQDRGELGRVVGWAGGDERPGDEVRVGIDRSGQLGPRAGRVLTPAPSDEVARGVTTIEAGGIDGDGGLLGDQAAAERGRDGAAEEVEEAPPFSSRSWAYLSVEKWGSLESPRSLRSSAKSARNATTPR